MSITWTNCSASGPYPPNMVSAGVDSDGSEIFAGRAYHEGDLIPAKIMPDKQACYVAWGGQEHLKESFEVLCRGELLWDFATCGQIPEGAMEVGRTAAGEPLYLARAVHEGSQTPGKLQVSHGVCYIAYGGQEIPYQEYEVLCFR